MAFGRKQRSAPQQDVAAAEASAPAPGQAEREALRLQHRVRPLTDDEDGIGVHRLPEGVYGFTYTPGIQDGPLFSSPRYHTFEVHKLAGGEVALVGFVSSETVSALETGADTIAVHLFPEPTDKAPNVVPIASSRILRIKELSTREEGALRLEVSPERERFVN